MNEFSIDKLNLEDFDWRLDEVFGSGQSARLIQRDEPVNPEVKVIFESPLFPQFSEGLVPIQNRASQEVNEEIASTLGVALPLSPTENSIGTSFDSELPTEIELTSPASVSTTSSDIPIQTYGRVVDSSDGLTPQSELSLPLINLDEFRADTRFSGIDGSGFATVILDTGIDLDHPFFGPDSDGNGVADRIVYHYDFADGDANASDFNGHGSNVSSIVASSDSQYTGIAPGADIIHLKVFKDNGQGNFSYVESALQWVVANADAYNIASVNMSLGDTGNYRTPQNLYGIADEMAALAADDVAVVSASGNDFYSFNSVQGVSYPAADPNSLSVGAVFDSDIGSASYFSGARAYTTGSDRIAPFSQRHETLTTVFAPGAPITGAGPNGDLITLHGTSQASPHVAGVAVLAQQLAEQELGRPLSVTELSDLMVSTGVTINDGDDEDDNVANTGLDFQRLDVLAFGEAILALAEPNEETGSDSDFNGDGNPDLVWRNTATGENQLWLMSEAALESVVTLPTENDLDWQLVATGDFNGDADTDLVWRNFSTGENVFWWMDGTQFEAQTAFTSQSDLNWEIVGAADFTGDQQDDLLWQNANTGEVEVWQMNGTSRQSTLALGRQWNSDWQVGGTGDFNGDSNTDILWHNTSRGFSLVWLLDGTERLGNAVVRAFPRLDLDWQPVGAADFTGDEQADVFWRNANTGENLVWQMDGTTRTDTLAATELSDPNWQAIL